MAQPTYAIGYIGAMTMKAGDIYNSAGILEVYPTATVMIMKTKTRKTDEPIRVSVNGHDAFEIEFNDQNYILTGNTYSFSHNCTVAIGIYKAVV